MQYNEIDVSDLLGETFVSHSTKIVGKRNLDYLLTFQTENARYIFYHEQDCCEDVWLEDVAGDLDDLIGAPILLSESVSNVENEDCSEVVQWTFIKLATVKGYVTLRFCGSSNGYYSMDVDLMKVSNEE